VHSNQTGTFWQEKILGAKFRIVVTGKHPSILEDEIVENLRALKQRNRFERPRQITRQIN
jgi:hypothetical protein